MEVVITIGIIIFLIWRFFGKHTSTNNNSSSTNNYDKYNIYQQELEEQKKLQDQLLFQKEQNAKEELVKIHIEEQRLQQEVDEFTEEQKEQAVLNLKITSYKENWIEFKQLLEQNNIIKFYHFTDRVNLPSIKEHGLLSWYYCQQNGIAILKPGGSSSSWNLDERKGLQNYVRVSFVKDHPMMFVAKNDGRISDVVILEVNIEIAYLENTKYACQNAVKNDEIAESSFGKFSSIKFPLFKKRYFDLPVEEKPYYQAEVLILEKIPLESIININLV